MSTVNRCVYEGDDLEDLEADVKATEVEQRATLLNKLQEGMRSMTLWAPVVRSSQTTQAKKDAEAFDPGFFRAALADVLEGNLAVTFGMAAKYINRLGNTEVALALARHSSEWDDYQTMHTQMSFPCSEGFFATWSKCVSFTPGCNDGFGFLGKLRPSSDEALAPWLARTQDACLLDCMVKAFGVVFKVADDPSAVPDAEASEQESEILGEDTPAEKDRHEIIITKPAPTTTQTNPSATLTTICILWKLHLGRMRWLLLDVSSYNICVDLRLGFVRCYVFVCVGLCFGYSIKPVFLTPGRYQKTNENH